MLIFITLALLLSPVHGKESLPYEKPQNMESGKTLEFADFKIVYEGAKETGDAASPSHSREDTYTVNSKYGAQKLKIKSGQAPPMPYEFTVGKQAYTLFTYSLPGTRIEPKQFAIFKKSPAKP